jgi:hypothetical protein
MVRHRLGAADGGSRLTWPIVAVVFFAFTLRSAVILGANGESAEQDAALFAQPVPDTVAGIVGQLRTRTDQIRGLIDRGSYAEVYVPAFQAKDLAVALEPHISELSVDFRDAAEAAIANLVREAYLLDAFGDLGNKQQISAAFAEFADAEQKIHSSFPSQ